MTFAAIRKTADWTTRCDQWLAQFSVDERATAELLLDSVNYISQDEVSHELQKSVYEFIPKCKGLVALYPVTNTKKKDGTEIFPPIEECDTFPLGAGGDVGSEGDLAHLCRDIAGAFKEKALLYPSFAELRTKEVHDVILITDTASSGDQVSDLLGWFWANRSIRSWHSFRKIRFHVITYLYTVDAEDAIRAHRSKPSFVGVQGCQRGSSIWKSPERDRIEELCKKYGSRDMALGYSDMMSLHIFAYSCPNNVPSILRYGTKRCRGLFGTRPTSASGASISGQENRLELAAKRWHLRLSTPLALICHLLLEKPRTSEDMSSHLCIPLEPVDEALKDATKRGYVRKLKYAFRLTEAGLTFARSLPICETCKSEDKTYSPLFDYLPACWNPASSSSFVPAEEGAP